MTCSTNQVKVILKKQIWKKKSKYKQHIYISNPKQQTERKRNRVHRTFMDLAEQLAGLCKKTRHRCWDWAQGLDSQLAHWKRLPAQRELDVCSLGGEASERGGGCSLSMTRKHCCLSQRGTESFLLISVGCISSFICWISDKKGKWEICIVPEWAWGLSSWLKSSLDGLLLPVAQISPASPSRRTAQLMNR